MSWFDRAANWMVDVAGGRVAFLTATGGTLLWLLAGPWFHYSDTWQLWANTITTVITFLMVFLIQHSQNRDNKAVQLKLDELVRAVEGARNEVAGVEKRGEENIEALDPTEAHAAPGPPAGAV